MITATCTAATASAVLAAAALAWHCPDLALAALTGVLITTYLLAELLTCHQR